MQAKGTFKVEMTPETNSISMNAPAQYARMSLTKAFGGDLTGNSIGEMLSVRLADSASAGYVALEQFTGSLGDASGSFVLQHYGTMTSESSTLLLKIVPDSGTNALTGISGEMAIDISEGQHFYELTYELG
jgi:hypothetical protein